MAREEDKGLLENELGVQSRDSYVHLVRKAKPSEVEKAEQDLLASNAFLEEDEFSGMYFDPASGEGRALRPPFDMNKLWELVTHNNTLLQLISAMEVNIDGTGFVIENEDPKEETEAEAQRRTDFIEPLFNEPYPGETFSSIRRKLRRDQEITGVGYLEVIRNLNGDIVFLKRVDPRFVRYLRLGAPRTVEKTVKRFGDEFTVTMSMRERGFAQVVAGKTMYFSEYGSPRRIHKRTGEWINPEDNVDPADFGTELLPFTLVPDAVSPYGLPRWINQLPSVLGSRKAEELNLDYFNSGGLPPAMVFLMGGQLTTKSRDALTGFMSGKGSNAHRGAVMEAVPTGGSIDNPGKVDIRVERFGSEQVKDELFGNYDTKNEERLRGAFRLPPMFVGKSQDYSFATATVSYTIAEAQVFKPERDEFDDKINSTIMRELDPRYRIRSLGVRVQDPQVQQNGVFRAIEKGAITNEEFINALNEITDVDLKFSGFEPENPGGGPGGGPVGGPTPRSENNEGEPIGAEDRRATGAEKSDDGQYDKISLAHDWAELIAGDREFNDEAIQLMKSEIEALDPADRHEFDQIVASKVFSGYNYDPEGAVELLGCACGVLHN